VHSFTTGLMHNQIQIIKKLPSVAFGKPNVIN
jgi:hypothetical protein